MKIIPISLHYFYQIEDKRQYKNESTDVQNFTVT